MSPFTRKGNIVTFPNLKWGKKMRVDSIFDVSDYIFLKICIDILSSKC